MFLLSGPKKIRCCLVNEILDHWRKILNHSVRCLTAMTLFTHKFCWCLIFRQSFDNKIGFACKWNFLQDKQNLQIIRKIHQLCSRAKCILLDPEKICCLRPSGLWQHISSWVYYTQVVLNSVSNYIMLSHTSDVIHYQVLCIFYCQCFST